MVQSRISIPVDPILRIPDQAIEPQVLVDRCINAFWRFERDRAEWIRRREGYYLAWDDYVTPVRKGLWEGASNYRYPLTETQCTALHALIMQAIFFYYPLFYVDPQEDVSRERIKKIELMMKYILERYANYNKGIYTAIDDWAWDLVTEGMAIFSRGWDVLYRRSLTVVENPIFKSQHRDLMARLDDTDASEFSELADSLAKQPYMEKSIIKPIFNGPIVTVEDPIFVLFKGEVVDCTDLNEHQTVIKVCYFTREQLVALRDSEYFDADVVDETLSGPPDRKVTSTIQGFSNPVRAAKDFQTGVNTSNPDNVEESWEFLCCYDTYSLNPRDRLSAPDRLQYFVRHKTRRLARWTYLDRISANGKIPLHMGHLYRRPRRSIGRGMVQTMYNMNDAADILVNQMIDSGTLANNPMFGYKADSSFDPQEIRVEPGLGIPMDNPAQDINFYRWGINAGWSQPVIAMIQSMAQQLTAIGPNTVGMVGDNVGPLRSATGVQALGANANIIHDVLIKRAKLPISELFEGLYMDCVQRMPESLKITVTGQDGVPVMDSDGTPIQQEISREELAHRVYFGLYATSQAMNPAMEQQKASSIAQMLLQKAAIETRVVGPMQIYNIYDNFLRANSIPNREKFIQKPGPDQALPEKYELQMIMEGMVPQITMVDDKRADKLMRYNELLNSDQAQLEAQHGIVAKNAMQILKHVIKEHERFAAMVEKPSNVQNPTGSNQSPIANQGGANIDASQDNSQSIVENNQQITQRPKEGSVAGGEMNE